MILKNYYNYIQAMCGLPIKCKLPNGNLDTFSIYGSDYGANDIAYNIRNIATSLGTGTSYGSNYGGVIFGNGNTAATENDYTLSGSIVNSFTYAYNRTQTNSAISCDFAITATADIIIREVGFMLYIRTGGASSRNILITREVLSTPISINNGDTITLRCTFTSSGLVVSV